MSGVGSQIQGADGRVWGTVVSEERKCWRLDSGRIAKKSTLGQKWHWRDTRGYGGHGNGSGGATAVAPPPAYGSSSAYGGYGAPAAPSIGMQQQQQPPPQPQ